MQYFKDSVSGRVYAFESNVVATADALGVYSFNTKNVSQWPDANTGELVDVVTLTPLNVPTTLQPCAKPAPTLAELQANQAASVAMACQAQITGNFTSSALGTVYTYPSKPTDQSNMDANVVSSLLPNLPANWTTQQMCADANGVWAYRAHTAAQIQQAGADGKAAILACLLKNDSLRTQINAITDSNPTNPSAQTIAAIAAIVW